MEIPYTPSPLAVGVLFSKVGLATIAATINVLL